MQNVGLKRLDWTHSVPSARDLVHRRSASICCCCTVFFIFSNTKHHRPSTIWSTSYSFCRTSRKCYAWTPCWHWWRRLYSSGHDYHLIDRQPKTDHHTHIYTLTNTNTRTHAHRTGRTQQTTIIISHSKWFCMFSGCIRKDQRASLCMLAQN